MAGLAIGPRPLGVPVAAEAVGQGRKEGGRKPQHVDRQDSRRHAGRFEQRHTDGGQAGEQGAGPLPGPAVERRPAEPRHDRRSDERHLHGQALRAVGTVGSAPHGPVHGHGLHQCGRCRQRQHARVRRLAPLAQRPPGPQGQRREARRPRQGGPQRSVVGGLGGLEERPQDAPLQHRHRRRIGAHHGRARRVGRQHDGRTVDLEQHLGPRAARLDDPDGHRPPGTPGVQRRPQPGDLVAAQQGHAVAFGQAQVEHLVGEGGTGPVRPALPGAQGRVELHRPLGRQCLQVALATTPGELAQGGRRVPGGGEVQAHPGEHVVRVERPVPDHVRAGRHPVPAGDRRGGRGGPALHVEAGPDPLGGGSLGPPHPQPAGQRHHLVAQVGRAQGLADQPAGDGHRRQVRGHQWCGGHLVPQRGLGDERRPQDRRRGVGARGDRAPDGHVGDVGDQVATRAAAVDRATAGPPRPRPRRCRPRGRLDAAPSVPASPWRGTGDTTPAEPGAAAPGQPAATTHVGGNPQDRTPPPHAGAPRTAGVRPGRTSSHIVVHRWHPSDHAGASRGFPPPGSHTKPALPSRRRPLRPYGGPNAPLRSRRTEGTSP